MGFVFAKVAKLFLYFGFSWPAVPTTLPAMATPDILDGLVNYLGLLILLTFHEVGHAWMAWKCGDDTARLQGRISLNPLVHIDPIGTVAMPLMMIFLSGSVVGQFLIGWAKPVPVNPLNFKNPRGDDVLVALAGPWMNLLLAVVFMGLARAGLALQSPEAIKFFLTMVNLNLVLCFFNLLPIPPLDGSHVVKSLVGMSYETYAKLCRFGFIAVIVAMNLPIVRSYLYETTHRSFLVLARWFGLA